MRLTVVCGGTDGGGGGGQKLGCVLLVVGCCAVEPWGFGLLGLVGCGCAELPGLVRMGLMIAGWRGGWGVVLFWLGGCVAGGLVGLGCLVRDA